jgi:nicotinamidase-related amidase
MKKPVLIVIDLQNDYFAGGRWTLSGIDAAAANAARVITYARNSGHTVIHIRHEFKTADPPFFAPGSAGTQINDLVKPIDGEAVVLKHEANSFLGTNLKQLLDAEGSNNLVFVGAMTQNCVDSTVRAAADMGYQATVIHDAIATLDLEFNGIKIPATQVHATFMAALGFAFATVQSADEYMQAAGVQNEYINL